jgi:Leucine-rich repeat (LRR) protein
MEDINNKIEKLNNNIMNINEFLFQIGRPFKTPWGVTFSAGDHNQKMALIACMRFRTNYKLIESGELQLAIPKISIPSTVSLYKNKKKELDELFKNSGYTPADFFGIDNAEIDKVIQNNDIKQGDVKNKHITTDETGTIILNYSGQHLVVLPEFPDYLETNLNKWVKKKLYCGNNKLLMLPTSLPTKIIMLDCSHNLLHMISMRNLGGLEYLYCSHNQLTTLPDYLPFNLKTLNCSHNLLTRLPDNLPAGLKIFNCSHNLLIRLPDNLPSGLKKLKCSENELTRLPDNLPIELKEFYCDENELTTLPDNLPSNLEILTCSLNQLPRLPDNLPPELKILKCCENELTRLPGNLPLGLKELLCSDNQLTRLPNLPISLEFMYASCNNLTDCYPLYDKYNEEDEDEKEGWDFFISSRTITYINEINKTLPSVVELVPETHAQKAAEPTIPELVKNTQPVGANPPPSNHMINDDNTQKVVELQLRIASLEEKMHNHTIEFELYKDKMESICNLNLEIIKGLMARYN